MIIPVSEALIRAELKGWIKKKHEERWMDRIDCRQTKMLTPSVYNNVWKQIRGLTRTRMKLATQLLTGHGTFQYHLWNMKFEEDPTCEQCLEGVETTEHFLSDCPAFAVPRYHTLGNMFLKQHELKNIKVSKILDFADKTERFL